MLDIFKKRRKKLLKNLPKNSVAVIATNPEQKRNNDVNYPFRPDSNFYYFTGFCEPNSMIIFSQKEDILFLMAKDELAEMWNGARLGLEEAKNQLQLKTKNINKIDSQLAKILQKYDQVYFDFSNVSNNLLDILTKNNYASLNQHIAKLRKIKDEIEITNLQKACAISDKAHIIAMQQIKNMDYEYQVWSIFAGFFTANNVQDAYPAIVASGKNGLILHYTNNNSKLQKDDLILIDAGCEYDYYASDITRTFPISGKFSVAQSEIYNLVLEAQLQAINAVQVGSSLENPHKVASKIIESGLKKLGILTTQTLKDFFPHGTSHFLGLDVHDVGKYKVKGSNKVWENFQENMIVTIEPGIYIKPDTKVAKKYHNIAIRIEDDILVKKSGAVILTNAPKTIEAIEKIMS